MLENEYNFHIAVAAVSAGPGIANTVCRRAAAAATTTANAVAARCRVPAGRSWPAATATASFPI